ncbi:aminotransferase class I/II-fold pyridoxal phosphate-dependent enzyme [Vibrio sp. CAIM 722]|uniref:Aminotransferase class I/II-fold pyridoxal phosphate-dependent enzyme n=1 Tax=Vibrio eleionomae TaxID=2653505 RepID=A0A7X4RX07_9VIBR|nr:aminotransferase class I/II-fold pyridoxal phosphate-dependent enzyme [Vibrio eleionomae]
MSEAKYRQIARIIEQRMDTGEYPAESKLPTHRQLADELETTPVTVSKAYQLLTDNGRVYSHVGRGTFVCASNSLSDVIHPTDEGKDYNLSILQPCLHYNLNAISQAFQVATRSLPLDMIGYTEHSGHEKHRATGVKWAKHYGLEGGQSHNTLLVDGAQHGLSLLINALTKPGDTIAVETMTYPGIMAIAGLAERQVVGIPMDDQGVTGQGLTQVIEQHQPKLVVIVPSHQNPTGVTMPLERRKQIANIIAKHQVWLLEDDIYGFLHQEPISAITNFVPERGFHITSLSKAISPALRCGFIKIPESQIAHIEAHIRTNIWLSAPINYAAATVMIESGEAFSLAEQQREIASQRQTIARELLPQALTSHDGFHIWLPLPEHWNQERFVMEAKNRGVLVSSGGYFNAPNSTNHHIRLSLMSVATDEGLRQALVILADLLAQPMTTVFPF